MLGVHEQAAWRSGKRCGFRCLRMKQHHLISRSNGSNGTSGCIGPGRHIQRCWQDFALNRSHGCPQVRQCSKWIPVFYTYLGFGRLWLMILQLLILQSMRDAWSLCCRRRGSVVQAFKVGPGEPATVLSVVMPSHTCSCMPPLAVRMCRWCSDMVYLSCGSP